MSDKEPTDEDKRREPFFGPNAWPLVVQLSAGLAAAFVADWLIGDSIYNATVTFTRFIGLT